MLLCLLLLIDPQLSLTLHFTMLPSGNAAPCSLLCNHTRSQRTSLPSAVSTHPLLTHLQSISMALPAQSISSPIRDTKYNLSCMVSLGQQDVFKYHLQHCLCLYCILLHDPIIFYWVAISHVLNSVINRLTFWLLLLSGCYRLCYYFHYCSVAL